METDAGLCIVFFAAKGEKGQDIFDPSLPERDGTFKQYTKGEIVSYHISYYANAAHNPDRGHANLRKNNKFILAQEGPEGIPTESEKIHKLRLIKAGNHIVMCVDDRKIIDWIDDGKQYDPVLTDGKIGFRQMRWTHFRYRNFKVWALNSGSNNESVENKTDVSMFLKKDQEYISKAESQSGDLWDELGHHGPAVENQWVGYRIYFDKKAAVDVYSKFQPRFEIKKTKWYTSKELQEQGYGADFYLVGNLIGLGSFRLWESDSVKLLHPVTNRSATVSRHGSISQIDFLSEGIPYKNVKTDILIRMTVFSNVRFAKMEAFVLDDQPVQLVTGISFQSDSLIEDEDRYILCWGEQTSPAAAQSVDLGIAVVYNPGDFERSMKREQEKLLISKPTKYLRVWISSANSKEQEMNTLAQFRDHVQKLVEDQIKK
ncbi:DUF1961 family protein [candidate division KSB1 bacterium]|nr:DUF1961 family protein [candidate division KSB1 bacterium]